MQIRRLLLETVHTDTLALFYKEILELPLTKETDGFIVSVGTSRIHFKQTAKTQEPFYHFALTIPANKIEEAKNWLQKKVALIWMEDYQNEVADFINWRAKAIYFFDTAGNIVELIARFDLNNAAYTPFSSKQLLSVSEIGLVFPQNEIEIKTAELMSATGLPFYSKQKPLANFKATGSDEGLFIIVPEHRNWYPTTKKAGIFPIEVEFYFDGKIYRKVF